MKYSNVIDSVRTTTSTVVDKVQSSTVVTTITSNKYYQIVDNACTTADKKLEDAGAAHAQAVVSFFSRLFNK